MSSINKHLTICPQMLKIWCINLSVFWQCSKKTCCIFSLFFVLEFGRLNWPKEQFSLSDICVLSLHGMCIQENIKTCIPRDLNVGAKTKTPGFKKRLQLIVMSLV